VVQIPGAISGEIENHERTRTKSYFVLIRGSNWFGQQNENRLLENLKLTNQQHAIAIPLGDNCDIMRAA